jgi:hypothetical protein
VGFILNFVTTTAHAQSALKRPVWLRPDLAFAGGCMRIEWDRHQCQNEVNRMDLVLYILLHRNATYGIAEEGVKNMNKSKGVPFPATLLATV